MTSSSESQQPRDSEPAPTAGLGEQPTHDAAAAAGDAEHTAYDTDAEPTSDGEHTTVTAEPEPPGLAVSTTGTYAAHTIGDPGRAFALATSVLETKHRDSHDVVIDAATVSDPEETPRLEVRAASVRGLSHQHYGDPRQDDHCLVLSEDGEWLIAMVADGVSSGEWSHLAAKVATEEGCAEVARLLRTMPPHEIPWREVHEGLADRLTDICATLPGKHAEVELSREEVSQRMATTLVAGVVATRPSEDGTHAVTVVRLGDVSGWILDEEDGWVALESIKNAGKVIAESATACLPLVPEAEPEVVVTTLGDGAALVLMTDGVGDPLGSGQGEVAGELARWWVRPPHPLEFASQVAFGRKSYDDDRGALAVWLARPEGSA